MTIKKRMTTEQWAEVRARWESDPRDGYKWIVTELGLAVSGEAVLKRSRTEGWAKKASLKTIVEHAQARADEKVSQKVRGKVRGLTFTDSVDLRADVIQTHRAEWGEHREVFTLASMSSENGLVLSRVAKTLAETIKIRQEGERKAWGLDAIAEDTSGGVATLSELDAMFAQAVKKSNELQDAVRKERGGASSAEFAADELDES